MLFRSVEPIATVDRLQARQEVVMDEVTGNVLRQAAASLVLGTLLTRG